MKTFRNLINGKYVTSLSGETFPDFNPANTDDILGHFQSSGREDADNACLAASKAFERWKDYPWVKKSRILRNTMNILERRRDELVYVLTKEQGRPLKESLAEVDRTIDVIDFYTGEVRRNQGWVMPSERPHTVAFTRRRPMGVFGVISPWNFRWLCRLGRSYRP